MTELINRYLISDSEIIKKLINNFSVISIDDNKWTKTFLDKTNNENWISYYVDTEQHGGGLNILGRLPIPSTDKLIQIAINSENEDEVLAACRTLTNNEELTKEDFRSKLIDKLEILTNRDKQKKIIEFTELTSTLNRQDIIGKTSKQIESDSSYYKQIADRAKKMK